MDKGDLASVAGARRAGDALLTGPHRERWPVRRERFDAAYAASVKVGWQDSPVEGGPGDWLVQYGPGNFGIVAAVIVDATYELL
jgi:hypothetical protein